MAISVTQRTLLGSAAATDPLVKAYTSNLTAGNASIVIGTTDGTAASLGTPTGTQGKAYNLVSTITGSGFVFKAWIAFNMNAAAESVSMPNGFNDCNMFLFEAAGLAASSAFDKSAFQNQTAVTALDSTSTATLTNANNLVIGVTANTHSPGLAPTVGTGYANLQTLTTGFNGGGTEEKIVASTTAVNATFGLASNSDNEVTAVFVFSDTVIGGAGPTAATDPAFYMRRPVFAPNNIKTIVTDY